MAAQIPLVRLLSGYDLLVSLNGQALGRGDVRMAFALTFSTGFFWAKTKPVQSNARANRIDTNRFFLILIFSPQIDYLIAAANTPSPAEGCRLCARIREEVFAFHRSGSSSKWSL